MRACEGCGQDIDTNDGVTAVPAQAGNVDNGEWWHPECRKAELRKRVGAAGGKTAAKPGRAKAGHAITASVDDDDSEV